MKTQNKIIFYSFKSDCVSVFIPGIPDFIEVQDNIEWKCT